MIEAKDLRIGNIIKRKSINNFCTVNASMIKDFENGHSVRDYEPVPLTADILKQFGFEWNEIIHRWVHDTTFYVVAQNEDGFNSGVEEGSVKRAQLKYLHQLQNVHDPLTGYELKRI